MREMQQERQGETDEQTYARAMRDPEVAEIMADPLMRRELKQPYLRTALTGRNLGGLATGP
jgi:hypothetical protein